MNQVHDAGHMVPMDQPKAALEMLRRWTRGGLSREFDVNMLAQKTGNALHFNAL
jgi:uncharacterized protein with von Willebrand factor type A (vWA) domain